MTNFVSAQFSASAASHKLLEVIFQSFTVKVKPWLRFLGFPLFQPNQQTPGASWDKSKKNIYSSLPV